ncbi:MAG: AI-2E family transporter [Thermomicrobiales bacterium]
MEQRESHTGESRGRRSRRASLTPLSLFLVLVIFYLVVQVRIVVLLLLFSILFATLVEGPVLRLEKHGWPRAAAILAVYMGILVLVAGLFLLVIPPITSEALRFWDEAPVLLDDLAEEWRTSGNSFLSTTGYRVATQLQFRIENPPPPTGSTAIGLVTGVGGVLFGLVSTFVIGFYYLMEKRLFRKLTLDLIRPNDPEWVNSVWDSVEAKLGDWLRGQLFLMLIIGLAAGAWYAILDVRFWLLLGLVAGITEAIPIIGPWIGGIPAVMLALVDSWEKAIAVAIFLGVLQLLENTILVPRVMRGTIGLSPLAVFIAVLAGGQFAGPLGALLALPIAATIQVIISEVLRAREKELAFEQAGGPFDSSSPWRAILTQFLGYDGVQEGERSGRERRRRPDATSEAGDGDSD